MSEPSSSAAYQPVRNPQGKVSWRDTFSVWPSVSVKIELMPWHWRLYVYRDDIEPYWDIHAGPLTLTLGANKGWFPLERTDG